MTKEVATAYLQGSLGDATYSKSHKTYRISQKDKRWLEKLKDLLQEIGDNSWIYREGSKRNVYVLETTSKKLSMDFDPTDLSTEIEKIAYVRGYFDAEGGIAHDGKVRFYLQFAEKDKSRLEKVQNLLEELGIQCGLMHNPSKKVDPYYWRFYVRARSFRKFAEQIGSWHPRKHQLLSSWMKI